MLYNNLIQEEHQVFDYIDVTIFQNNGDSGDDSYYHKLNAYSSLIYKL
jgi:hypothetical protein